MSISHTSPVNWHKSSYSSSHGQNCVEVGDLPNATAVRDTQHRELGHLEFPAEEWRALLGAAVRR